MRRRPVEGDSNDESTGAKSHGNEESTLAPAALVAK
jgi:hypothetical protein